jgi:hypothetical protein
MTEKMDIFVTEEVNKEILKGISELINEGHDIERLIDPKNSNNFSEEMNRMVEKNSSL